MSPFVPLFTITLTEYRENPFLPADFQNATGRELLLHALEVSMLPGRSPGRVEYASSFPFPSCFLQISSSRFRHYNAALRSSCASASFAALSSAFTMRTTSSSRSWIRFPLFPQLPPPHVVRVANFSSVIGSPESSTRRWKNR